MSLLTNNHCCGWHCSAGMNWQDLIMFEILVSLMIYLVGAAVGGILENLVTINY